MDSKPSPTLYWGPVTLMGYTPKNLLWFGTNFCHTAGWFFWTPFLKEVDRSDSTSVHQYILRTLSAWSVKHGSTATKFQAVFSMMLFRTWFAVFTLGGFISSVKNLLCFPYQWKWCFVHISRISASTCGREEAGRSDNTTLAENPHHPWHKTALTITNCCTSHDAKRKHQDKKL